MNKSLSWHDTYLFLSFLFSIYSFSGYSISLHLYLNYTTVLIRRAGIMSKLLVRAASNKCLVISSLFCPKVHVSSLSLLFVIPTILAPAHSPDISNLSIFKGATDRSNFQNAPARPVSFSHSQSFASILLSSLATEPSVCVTVCLRLEEASPNKISECGYEKSSAASLGKEWLNKNYR